MTMRLIDDLGKEVGHLNLYGPTTKELQPIAEALFQQAPELARIELEHEGAGSVEWLRPIQKDAA